MSDNEIKDDKQGRDTQWERDLINRLSFAALAEQKRARRWNIFFKLLLFSYLFILLFMALKGPKFGESSIKAGAHTAMVEVNGVIADSTRANADNIIKGLRAAFNDSNTKGIVLRINSPGGSPVQADYVYREIKRLREKHKDIPVYAVIVDIGASGAYYIASAADDIYVNPASIVGSIGVLMNGFGFVGTMEKLGVERRLITAGKNKGMLDPFEPLKPEDVKHVKMLLGQIHEQFIDAVKQGRGDRLKDNPELFSGKFWDGRQSIELGLADEIGDVDYVAREVIGAKNIVDYTPKPDFFKRFADRIGATMANVLTEQVGLNTGSIR